MHRIKPVFMFALLALSVMACASSGEPVVEDATLNAVVATVNGAPIKKAEFKQELDSTYQRFHQSGQMIDGTMYEQLKKEVLESLIHLILMDQHSEKLAINVDETQVENLYQKAIAQYASKGAYKKSLKEAGLTEADLRTRLKRTLAAQAVVQQQVVPKVQVSDQEIRAYYDENTYEFEHDVQVHAAHILIKVNALDGKEERAKAKARILEIQKKVKAGADFAELAKKYSEGPSKVNGGDIGYFASAEMAPTFETAAFSLNPGEVSEVVTTNFGYHLIKVYDRKPAGKVSFEEAAPQLKARFHQERLNAQMRLLVDQLKGEAKIERFSLDD